ncbi:response regulator [Chryseolinea lacunae]|uniref:Response regulator n=1 Tax=Chryseolinea lacunae TaxID=2801331 RepID=A0ABS1L1Y8_9BACT|nr:response regulator [Chryseolinea lacunae]MBL0745724.1 response regulator [Chryseolinea lacunae]
MLILEVDDDEDDRELFLDALNTIDPSISCQQLESGKDVLDYLNEAKLLPDFIFMDVNMPKMTGYECVNLIRSIPRFELVQIVMYSTAFNPEERANLSSKGIKFLSKTALFSELVEGIKKLTGCEFMALAKGS